MKDAEAARLDALIASVHGAAQVLPALTAQNGATERVRLIEALTRGQRVDPRFVYTPRKTERAVHESLAAARGLAHVSPAAALYLARLDELELELRILEAIGDMHAVRPLAAQRYGTGAMSVALHPCESTAVAERREDTTTSALAAERREDTTTSALAADARAAASIDASMTTVARAARVILATTAIAAPEPRTLPADDARGGPSAAAIVREIALAAGVDVVVRVEPRLAAAAASGERMVLLAARAFGPREALRIAVHEVLGHLVSAINARVQPLRLLEIGTANSFGDQEGVALVLEEDVGVLDTGRIRTLAARVLATDAMHAGMAFGDCALLLLRDHGLAPDAAIAVTERAYRGGGVARDAGYLRGWRRVRCAIAAASTSVDELRMGRVGVDDVGALRRLVSAGVLRESVYRPTIDVALQRAREFRNGV